MNNLALRVYWANSPMPINQKIENPDVILNIPFGNILVLGDVPVKSVNSKTGNVVLKAQDVGAEPLGAVNNVQTQLLNAINDIRNLAYQNQLNITKKADEIEFVEAQKNIEQNRIDILNRATIQMLANLADQLNNKADFEFVQNAVGQLYEIDGAVFNAIQEISAALKENEDLLEALDYTVANRVRFDIATQALSSLQKSNARINIGAEEIGTAALLISQITLDSLGAATKRQGELAESALQSADVAPVALSGSFSSLNAQDKIFDVPFSAYSDGENSEITALDSLGVMLRKLQKQIKSLGGSSVEWVSIEQIGTFNTQVFEYAVLGNGPNKSTTKIEFARIDGNLWIRGIFKGKYGGNVRDVKLLEIADKNYKYFARGSSYDGYIDITQGANFYRWRMSSYYSHYDEYTATLGVQTINVDDFLSYNTNEWYMIKPQAIGILVI